jgi:hypothetical protein
MDVEEYLTQTCPDVEFEGIVSTIPGDTANVRVFPVDSPGGAKGIVIRRSDILDVAPAGRLSLQSGVPGNVARLRVRTANVAELGDEVWPIDWQALIESRLLPDGDRIHVTFEPLDPNTLGGEVRLILSRDVTWWKMVEVYGRFDTGPRRLAYAEASNDHDPHDAHFTNGGLQDGFVVLWKAKEFGIHKPKYVLSNVYERLSAQRAVFTWLDD